MIILIFHVDRKMRQYVLNWEGKKPGSKIDEAQPTFQSVAALDKYGNTISFQNECITEELRR